MNSVEKLFKSLYAKTHTTEPISPKIHNLIRLAELCNSSLSKEQKEKLGIINTFNIEARYDDFKNDFYKICTKEFSEVQINNIKGVREWIKKLINK
jgi:HEPN domain-containing protein